MLLYAESHYKFKGIYSRLLKKEPEVIADAPHRLNPDELLPIFIIVKDADRFPIVLETIEVKLDSKANSICQTFQLNEKIFMPFWTKTFSIKPPEGFSGTIDVDVKMTLVNHLGRKSYYNDNYRISSHEPLRVYLSGDKLPAAANWYFGDLHVHSNYTSDQVEFGAGITDTVTAARAIGLHFLAITDHSYDLDDHFDNYLKNHPDLPKWQAFCAEVARLNERDRDFVIIPGEEVSCGNGHNRNIHFLIFASPEFYPGYGDSAERWFRTRPQLRAREILERLPATALAFAAHPEVLPPFVQRVLIHRGRWLDSDYHHPRLNGMQILNGDRDRWFDKGIKKWVELLLRGRKLIIIAGNDAHGNFNRFRQIGTPFFTMVENDDQIMGKCRTGLFVPDGFSPENIRQALRNGRAIITDGPFASMTIFTQNGRAEIGSEMADAALQLEIIAKSTPEFGPLARIDACCGDIPNRREFVFFQKRLAGEQYEFRTRLDSIPLVSKGYIRLDVISKKGSKEFRCLTNPIWCNNSH